MKHIVMSSGGVGSWATAKRVAEKHGTENLLLVFADTLSEDDDLYRFLIEGSANVFGLNVSVPVRLPPLQQREQRKAAIRELAAAASQAIPGLIWLAEGRDIWDVFLDARFLGNSSIDPCSSVLKRQFLRGWIRATFVPYVQQSLEQKGLATDSQAGIHEAVRMGEAITKRVQSLERQHRYREAAEAGRLLRESEAAVAGSLTFYIGYEWTELDRWNKAKRFWEPYRLECPLADPPYLDKSALIQEMMDAGISIPLLYRLNMPHNNCYGRCVKAGHAQWYRLLEVLPEVFSFSEEMEQQWQQHTGSDKTILKDRRGGRTRPLSLAEFRLRWDSYPEEKKQSVRDAWSRNFGILPENLLGELQTAGIDLSDTSGCGCFSGV